MQISALNLIQDTDTNLLGSKFPSNHLQLERFPGVVIFNNACGTVTVAQLSSRRCRYDPHFPSTYMFITRSLFSCCWYSGKLRSNWGADLSTIKKHLQQIDKTFHSSNSPSVLYVNMTSLYLDSKDSVFRNRGTNIAHSDFPIFLEKKPRVQYNTHLFDSSQKTYIMLIL